MVRFLSMIAVLVFVSVASATGIPRVAGVTCGSGGGVTFAPSYAPQVFAAPAYGTCGVQQSFAVQSYAPQVFAAPVYSYGVQQFAVPSYGFQSFGINRNFGINRGFAVQRGFGFNTGINVNVNRGLFRSNVNINRGFVAPVGAQQINIRSGLFGRQRVQINSFGF